MDRWWGPDGFTDTFNVCDFKAGGRWSLVMHGPDGKNYPNENVFAEIEPPMNVVVQHISEPKLSPDHHVGSLCGYDLRATPAVCPECGQSVPLNLPFRRQ